MPLHGSHCPPLPAPTLLSILAPGIEYVLRDAQPPHLFVICRQHRAAPSAPAAPQAVYYVLDGTVYQAPALHAALTNRMVRRGDGGGAMRGVTGVWGTDGWEACQRPGHALRV